MSSFAALWRIPHERFALEGGYPMSENSKRWYVRVEERDTNGTVTHAFSQDFDSLDLSALANYLNPVDYLKLGIDEWLRWQAVSKYPCKHTWEPSKQPMGARVEECRKCGEARSISDKVRDNHPSEDATKPHVHRHIGTPPYQHVVCVDCGVYYIPPEPATKPNTHLCPECGAYIP